MVRRTPIALLLAASSCSLSMTPLGPDYDERTIPRCETDVINPIGDALAAAGFAGLGIYGAVEGTSDDKWKIVVGTELLALALVGVAAIGFNWDSGCVAAKEQWDQRQIDQDTLVQQSRRRKVAEAKAARREAKEQEVKPKSSPTPPRGFYCSTSTGAPLAGLCTRQKADCERARDGALAAVADLSTCALTEKAWCFDAGSGNDDERCAPTTDGCAAMQARAAAGGSVGDCAEQE